MLGSNIFNILVGLGLPWLLQSLVTGEPYPLNPEEPLGLFVIIMLLYLLIFFVLIYGNRWQLDERLAYAFFVAHLCFVVFAAVVTFVDTGLG